MKENAEEEKKSNVIPNKWGDGRKGVEKGPPGSEQGLEGPEIYQTEAYKSLENGRYWEEIRIWLWQCFLDGEICGDCVDILLHILPFSCHEYVILQRQFYMDHKFS